VIKRFTAVSTDANQPEILEGRRGVGAQVWYIGWPLDLLGAFRGEFHVLEIKMQGKIPSKKQERVIRQMKACGCTAHVVYNPGDALRAIGAIGVNGD